MVEHTYALLLPPPLPRSHSLACGYAPGAPADGTTTHPITAAWQPNCA
ncbi:hypothetical protein ABZ865_34130 [Streptomyces sp. NPDC047085]